MYQGGAIVWSLATGAHESTGAIRAAWQSTGFENGRGKMTDIVGAITVS